MAVGRNFLSSRGLCFILYFYLIFGDLPTRKIVCTTLVTNCAVLHASREAAIVKLQTYAIRRPTVKKQPLKFSILLIHGKRIFLHASIALMLICLSGDVHSNPGPCTTSFDFQGMGVIKKTQRCLSFNARSLSSLNKLIDGTLASNLKSFQDLVYAESLDIIAVTETWLDNSVADNEILPCGYKIVRKDRSSDKRGGGVLLALRNGLQYSRIASGKWSDNLEIIAVELETTNSKKCLLCVCYRPPNCDLKEWLDLFTSFLEVTERYEKILIAGDFNFADLTWNSDLTPNPRTISACAVEFRELISDFFLQQINMHPTRLNNILDLVFTNIPEAIANV